MFKLGIDPEKLYRTTFISQYGLCCCNMALVSFRLFCKNLGHLRRFFGQMAYRPLWQKISRTPMVKTIATWKTVIESMQSLGMDKFRVAFTDFSLSILTMLVDFTMAKHRRNGKVRQVSPLTPRPNLNGRQNF